MHKIKISEIAVVIITNLCNYIKYKCTNFQLDENKLSILDTKFMSLSKKIQIIKKQSY